MLSPELLLKVSIRNLKSQIFSCHRINRHGAGLCWKTVQNNCINYILEFYIPNFYPVSILLVKLDMYVWWAPLSMYMYFTPRKQFLIEKQRCLYKYIHNIWRNNVYKRIIYKRIVVSWRVRNMREMQVHFTVECRAQLSMSVHSIFPDTLNHLKNMLSDRRRQSITHTCPRTRPNVCPYAFRVKVSV